MNQVLWVFLDVTQIKFAMLVFLVCICWKCKKKKSPSEMQSNMVLDVEVLF